MAREGGELVLRDRVPAGHPRVRRACSSAGLSDFSLVAEAIRLDEDPGPDRLRALSPCSPQNAARNGRHPDGVWAAVLWRQPGFEFFQCLWALAVDGECLRGDAEHARGLVDHWRRTVDR